MATHGVLIHGTFDTQRRYDDVLYMDDEQYAWYNEHANQRSLDAAVRFLDFIFSGVSEDDKNLEVTLSVSSYKTPFMMHFHAQKWKALNSISEKRFEVLFRLLTGAGIPYAGIEVTEYCEV